MRSARAKKTTNDSAEAAPVITAAAGSQASGSKRKTPVQDAVELDEDFVDEQLKTKVQRKTKEPTARTAPQTGPIEPAPAAPAPAASVDAIGQKQPQKSTPATSDVPMTQKQQFAQADAAIGFTEFPADVEELSSGEEGEEDDESEKEHKEPVAGAGDEKKKKESQTAKEGVERAASPEISISDVKDLSLIPLEIDCGNLEQPNHLPRGFLDVISTTDTQQPVVMPEVIFMNDKVCFISFFSSFLCF